MKLQTYIIPLLLLFGFSSRGQTVKRISLSEALSIASKSNRQIQIQTLEERRVKENTREARSQLLPGVSAGGSYQYYFDRQVIFLPGYFAGTTKPVQEVAVGGKHAFNGIVSASQPLLNEAARKQVKAAVYDERIQREKTADLESRLAEQISISYLNMLFMQSQIDLQEQSYSRNTKALNDTRSLYMQGRALKADTLRAYIAVENLRSSISYLKNNLEVSAIHLRRLIGLDDAVDISLADSLRPEIDANPPLESGAALETAYQNRNDITIQKLVAEKSRIAQAAARAEHLPRIAAIGQYQIQAQADDLRFGRYAWPPTSFVGVQVTVPVFAGNRIQSRVSEATIRIKQEAIALDDMQRSVKAELAAQVMQWKEAIQQLGIQKKTIDLADVSYAMIADRYRNGLSTRLELTDAELALTQAKLNYLQAIYNHKVIQVQLRRSQGLLKLQ